MAPDSTRADVVLGDELVRVFKLLQTARLRAPRVHPGVDPLAYPLLFTLRRGPRRVSDLAVAVHSDVSTVSRQVRSLVDLDLVRRGPDPDDRRAQALTLTAGGEALVIRIREERDAWLTDLLHGWSPTDTRAFARLLARFATDLETSFGTTRSPR
ncbi:MAG: MarR family winged helix-turn-helix transcriptional regulator [Phycicoccus sp.]